MVEPIASPNPSLTFIIFSAQTTINNDSLYLTLSFEDFESRISHGDYLLTSKDSLYDNTNWGYD